jgi:hypothetical protein
MNDDYTPAAPPIGDRKINSPEYPETSDAERAARAANTEWLERNAKIITDLTEDWRDEVRTAYFRQCGFYPENEDMPYCGVNELYDDLRALLHKQAEAKTTTK